ncbi:MAG TPA: FtsX-like permease family protein [Micromonosporaceae bacterium]
MLEVVLAALRSRRSATIALFLLAALVTTGATAAPFTVAAATAAVTGVDARNAPTTQRMVLLSEPVDLQSIGIAGAADNTTGIATAAAQLDDALTLPGAISVDTVEADATAAPPLTANQEIAYRDDVCAHTTLTGACPSRTGEALVSRAYAAAVHVGIGDRIPWTAQAQNASADLHIVGIYQPLDPTDPYWGADLLATGAPAGSSVADAIFVTRATLEADAQSVRCVRMQIVTPASIQRYGAAGIDADIDNAHDLAVTRNYSVDATFAPLANRIQVDTAFTTTAIGALAIELVALGWFALYLVLRASSAARRPDRGIHLLRGVPRGRIGVIVALQSALPMLAAVPVGAVAGTVGAHALAGRTPPDHAVVSAAIAAGAVLVVLLGAVVAAGIADRRASRASIPELLRETPARRSDRRAAAIDLVVFALAALAVIEVRIAGAGSAGLAAAAPMLVAAAVAVAAARLLTPVCRRFIADGLRRGRTAGVLTATYLARRQGLDRILVLTIVAVAALANAVLSGHVVADAQSTRAVQELGADRVVQLRNVPVAQVLADTHAADPAGRYLMAVSAFAGGDVLAVDSSRLANVLAGGDGWPPGAAIARTLTAAAPAPTSFRTGALAMTADTTLLPRPPVDIVVDLVDSDGAARTVRFGPILAGAHTYPASLTGCPVGCTVVDLRVDDATTTSTPRTGFTAVVSALGVPGGSGLEFTDRERWRTSAATDVIGPTLSGGPDGLRIALTDDSLSEEVRFDDRVFPIDAPLPLPALVSGTPIAGAGAATVTPFADLTVPVRVAGTTPVLPQLGTDGALVDLADALRLDGGAGAGGTPEIWMRADTPTSVAARVLAGRDIVSDRTVRSVRAALVTQAPAVVVRFTLVAGLIAILLALIAAVLTDSFERGVDLIALRRQGLSRRAVTVTAVARHAVVTVTALVAGVGAVAIGRLIVPGQNVAFTDGWTTPPRPHVTAGGWLLGVVAVAVPLLLIGGYAARRLIVRVRSVTR